MSDINDKVYDIWLDELSEWFIDRLEIELEIQELDISTTNLVIVRQAMDVNNYNLENYLFTKYWVEFFRAVRKLIKETK